MNNYINEIILSGKILSIIINEKHIAISIENQIFKNKIAFISLRAYKDLYEKYKDLFFIDNFIFIKGYVNSYKDKNNKINNYILITQISESIEELNTSIPHIRYDEDGTMVWNGTRCAIEPLVNKKDIEFMNNFYKEFGGDDNDS